MQIKKTVKTEQRNTKTKNSLEIVVPLKHLSHFWRTLDMSFINCEISLTLTLSGDCILTDITTQVALAAQENDPA